MDTDLLESYPVTFGAVESLGYYGSGEDIRGFNFAEVRESIATDLLDHSLGAERSGPAWRAFDVPATEVAQDETKRWDRRYWEPAVRQCAQELVEAGAPTIADLNQVDTRRGRSPQAAQYVDEMDGFAAVVKAGSCITRFGEVDLDGADWIEKAVYDEMPEAVTLQKGDVLLASTGDGTLGKAAVWDQDMPAIADGHVTIIRVDSTRVDPKYLADYLRTGFGQDQIRRLYTGSTGLIELTSEHVNRIVVAMAGDIEAQGSLSTALREAESSFRNTQDTAVSALQGSPRKVR